MLFAKKIILGGDKNIMTHIEFGHLVENFSSYVLLALDGLAKKAAICIATGLGSAWLATLLWNVASQRLSASLCGQLIVSETVFALFYSFAWDGHWPSLAQWAACLLFVFGILVSIKAHR